MVTTEACNEYMDSGRNFPPKLIEGIMKGVKDIEKKSKALFGGSLDDPSIPPLLLSVRSGAPVPMPGILDTVLNIGINDRVLATMLNITNNPRYCYDIFRRFIQVNRFIQDLSFYIFNNCCE